jgi:hypothetical protein
MPGLLDFFRKPKDITREWKTAKLIQESDNTIDFQYFVMSREDVSKIDVLQNVLMGQMQVMIMTTADLDFNQTSKIILDDGFQYSYVAQYTSKSETENNIFKMKGIAQKRYITLRRLDS